MGNAPSVSSTAATSIRRAEYSRSRRTVTWMLEMTAKFQARLSTRPSGER